MQILMSMHYYPMHDISRYYRKTITYFDLEKNIIPPSYIKIEIVGFPLSIVPK